MRDVLGGRVGHNSLLVAVVLALTQPNLGSFALWDVDEGVNAEAAREMMETGTWIVPTFNYELRTAKPVFLYWIQRASYAAFGVSEWAARFPATMLAIGTVLLVYELARRMFGPATGLLSGVVLASAITFCQLSHAATPDAPLIFFNTLTLVLFWTNYRRREWWAFLPAAAASGLAALTKGPVGLLLPGAIVAGYFLWNRELGRFWDRRLIWAGLTFLLVAAPWYVLVTTETKGEYIRAFLMKENVSRFLAPMEGHRGPVVYYLGALLVFFAPWSVLLGGTLWYAVKSARSRPAVDTVEPPAHRPYRFLLCWFGAYLAFFSFAATKLPNYIAPLYPAIAILTAAFLERWRAGAVNPVKWYMPSVAAGLASVGLIVMAAMLIIGGAIPLPGVTVRVLPGMETWAILGLAPLAGAAGMAWRLRRGDRDGALFAFTFSAVVFVGTMSAFPVVTLDRYNAPRGLVSESGAADDTRDVRIASLEFTAPSVTFYTRREVKRLPSREAAAEFLALPCPTFLFLPEPAWKAVEPFCTSFYRVAARRYDLTRHCDILVVTNDR